MRAVYGLYTTPESAQQAYDDLRKEGISEDEITVMSAEPLEGFDFGTRHRRTLMPWIAVAGALIGLSTGYFLTSQTQQAWPIDTGGMPIVSNWTNIIVMFELAMLGAVLSTVVTLLVSAGLPSRLPRFYDPEVAEGKILVGVTNLPASKTEQIERALDTGGTKIVFISGVPGVESRESPGSAVA